MPITAPIAVPATTDIPKVIMKPSPVYAPSARNVWEVTYFHRATAMDDGLDVKAWSTYPAVANHCHSTRMTTTVVSPSAGSSQRRSGGGRSHFSSVSGSGVEIVSSNIPASSPTDLLDKIVPLEPSDC